MHTVCLGTSYHSAGIDSYGTDMGTGVLMTQVNDINECSYSWFENQNLAP